MTVIDVEKFSQKEVLIFFSNVQVVKKEKEVQKQTILKSNWIFTTKRCGTVLLRRDILLIE